jgi:HlyD family secretion protein
MHNMAKTVPPASSGPRRSPTRAAGILRLLSFKVLCLVAALAAGCSPRQATAAEESSPIDADELTVRRATLQDRILLTGELEAVQSEKIHVPRTRAWQLPIRWMEQDGAAVVKGQKVLELDNSQFTGDLEQKKLARSGAENDLLRKEADQEGDLADKLFALERQRIQMEKARIEAEVPESLRPRREHQEAQLALARAEFDRAKAEEDLATARRASEAEIEELRIALRRAGDEITTAEQAIAALSLAAPRDGILIVAENRGEGRKFQVGDTVWVGLPVMRIPDLSAMKVVARLSDVDDGRIAAGDRAVCTLDTYPELTFAGQVTEIAPIAQEERDQSLRRSFRVEIMLDESDPERMRPGMSVKAEVFPAKIADSLIVPRLAVDLTTSPPRAHLADGSTAEVQLGSCTSTDCVVEDGLAEGMRLRQAG